MTSITWDRREYDRMRHARQRAILVDYMGGKCAHCGSIDSLEFDHIDPSSKSFSIMKHANRGLEFLIPELAKCQMLCVECHKVKSRAAITVPHGGGLMGKNGCRCDPCRIRKNLYVRDLKRKLRARGIGC